MSIQEINEKFPVKILMDLQPMDIHLVDDDDSIHMLIQDALKWHELTNLLPWYDPDVYKEYLVKNPGVLPHICVFDYLFKDPITDERKILDGLDLTRTIMKRAEDMDELAKPKVIMITGFPPGNLDRDFCNADGFRIVRKGDDFQVFKRDFLDAFNTAAVRLKKVLERASYFLKMEEAQKEQREMLKHIELLTKPE